MKQFSGIILCLVLFGCGKKQDATTTTINPIKISSAGSTKDSKDQFRLENYLATGSPDPSKIQVIDFNCAVFIYPSHEQIEEMKKAEGEDEFYTIADDANFYQTRAIQILDSAGVKIIGANKAFLKFVGKDNQWTLEIRKKDLPAWNLILFTRGKGPQPSPSISVTIESVKSYFE